jgi:hypothetical protein
MTMRIPALVEGAIMIIATALVALVYWLIRGSNGSRHARLRMVRDPLERLRPARLVAGARSYFEGLLDEEDTGFDLAAHEEARAHSPFGTRQSCAATGFCRE